MREGWPIATVSITACAASGSFTESIETLVEMGISTLSPAAVSVMSTLIIMSVCWLLTSCISLMARAMADSKLSCPQAGRASASSAASARERIRADLFILSPFCGLRRRGS